jgi:Flp pilus assembly protein TadD
VQTALDDFSRALVLNPADAGTTTNAGATCSRLTRHAEALRYFDAALEIDPK